MNAELIWELYESQHRRIASLGSGKNGGFKYFRPFFRRALVKLGRTLGCMDDRDSAPLKLPGSGLLLAWRRGIPYALAVVEATGADSLTTHKQCGAAMFVARGMRMPFKWFAELLARSWGLFVKWKLGLRYLGHLPVNSDKHAALAAVVDGTGRWNSSVVANSVPSFGINVKHQGIDNAMFDFLLAMNLAFRSNVGLKFTDVEKGRPFLVIVIGDPRHDDRSEDRIREVVARVIEQHSERERIKMISFSPQLSDFPEV